MRSVEQPSKGCGRTANQQQQQQHPRPGARLRWLQLAKSLRAKASNCLPCVRQGGPLRPSPSWVGRGGRAAGRRQKKIVPRGDGPRVVCVLRRRGGAEQQQEDDGRAVALLGLVLPTALAPRGPVKCRADERSVLWVLLGCSIKSNQGQARQKQSTRSIEIKTMDGRAAHFVIE